MSSDLFTTEAYWPQRLLRLDGDLIRSIQRIGPRTYDGRDSPRYNILSYTWGRWETDVGRALPIMNTTWKIPIVDPKGFSVKSLAKVIQHVSQESHMWLDIGCIDQENQSMKMSEIGKQAAIFRGAEKAYIWLSQSKRNTLKPFILEALSRDALEIEGSLRPWLNRICAGVDLIFSDPWFSSLWCLQEGFLRRDAILLFDDASYLDIPKFESYSSTGGPCTLLDIVKGYQVIQTKIRANLRYYPERFGVQGVTRAQDVCQRLDNLGIPCIAQKHAIALYGVASLRNPMRELDRIYGIMQVFGFVLGQSAQPDKEFTLSELEDQLGEAANRENPVLAQSFIHLTDPAPDRRWCLSRNMRVFSFSPVVNRELDRPQSYCRITVKGSDARAQFHGHKAFFEDLTTRIRGPDDSGTYRSLYFDHTAENRRILPESFFGADAWLAPRIEEVKKSMQESVGREVAVLLIGSMDDVPLTWLGVIAHPSPVENHPNKRYWKRIGICTWDMSLDYLRNNFRDLFQKEVIDLA